MKKIITPIIIIMAFLFACSNDILIPEADTDIPVVEAFLEPGKEVTVQLSRMIPFTSEEYTGSLIIDEADVFISYKGTDYLLTPVDNDLGKYISTDSNLIIASGDLYELLFEYNGYKVTSTTTVPSRPQNFKLSSYILYIDPYAFGPGAVSNPVTVSWDNPDNSYHLIITEYLESVYDPISRNLDPANYDQYRKVSTDPVQDEAYNLNTRQNLLFFGSYRIILTKVNQEYVNLFENVSQSSLNLTEPMTNIENGLGIFTGLNSDTLYLEVERAF